MECLPSQVLLDRSLPLVVAVSGGVDSVVLLDMVMRARIGRPEGVVVAHFDHGMRPDSAAGERFVRGLARRYGVAYTTRREQLGPAAGETLARARRYRFLHQVARRHRARLVTAHQADDAVETIAINLARGTGWRGLAPLGDGRVVRPLWALAKADLYAYALRHNLEWYEDSSNQSDRYLRNRLRRALVRLPAGQRNHLWRLWRRQRRLTGLINADLDRLLRWVVDRRYGLIMVPDSVAIEAVRRQVQRASGRLPTRLSAGRALWAIKAARPGTQYQLGGGVKLLCERQHFYLLVDDQ